MQLNEAVSRRLVELMQERGMTQYQLYMKSGVPKSTIGNLVNCACRTSSCSAADFLARLSALQDPEKDSEIRAALSSLNWPAWLKPGSLRICCLKMYPACYLMTEGGRLRRSSTRWTDWGMAWNGNVLTAKISAFPSQETACTLSDILMSDVQQFIREQKRPDYFL